MRISACVLPLVLATFTSAAPNVKDYVYQIKETVDPSRRWIKQRRAPQDFTIELRIALTQPNFPELEKHLYEISDPYHERYGSHLSKEEVEELVAPHAESLQLVDEWLASHGLLEDAFTRSPAKDWVRVKIPISLAEKMLDTEYYVFEHVDGTDTVVRTTSYSLPGHLHSHIDIVQPTTLFSTMRSMGINVHLNENEATAGTTNGPPISVPSASGGHVDASCNGTITISCLQQLYNMVGYKPSAAKKNHIGITGYLEQFANIQDLKSFYADQRPDALNSTFKFVSVKGGLNNQTLSEAGVEANLDTQFAFGLTYPTPGTFYSTAGRPPYNPTPNEPVNMNEPYTDWLDFILSHPSPPQTISTSYGEPEYSVPESFARRACAGFAQLGARGVSVLFSSGDQGVGDIVASPPNPVTGQCSTNDGRNTTRFPANFPASCPYVTTVGGTFRVPETAVPFSSGGFSDYADPMFKQPAYQTAAVSAYLKSLPKGTYAGLFNPKGRAYPDVAAQGDFFRVFVSGKPVSVGGTSCSSPTFAAVVALLNDARLSEHLPPLGFLNPLIYTIGAHHPDGFNDITTGNNPGCGTPGFNATKGWDPVTGFGTPNFGRLREIVTSELCN